MFKKVISYNMVDSFLCVETGVKWGWGYDTLNFSLLTDLKVTCTFHTYGAPRYGALKSHVSADMINAGNETNCKL